jgi:hypothetical protein
MYEWLHAVNVLWIALLVIPWLALIAALGYAAIHMALRSPYRPKHS